MVNNLRFIDPHPRILQQRAPTASFVTLYTRGPSYALQT